MNRGSSRPRSPRRLLLLATAERGVLRSVHYTIYDKDRRIGRLRVDVSGRSGNPVAQQEPAARNANYGPEEAMQIDSHVHVWVHDPAYPWAPGVRAPGEDATAEELLALMAAHGTEKTVLVQVIHYKWDNRYAGECLRRYPERFEG